MKEQVSERFNKIDAFILKLQDKFERINFEEKLSVDFLAKVTDMQKDIAKITAAEAKAWHYLNKERPEDEAV